jgi:hypothetical protein
VSARYILFGVGAVFLIAAVIRMNRDGWRLGPASRTWLLVAAIFWAVALWLSRTA